MPLREQQATPERRISSVEAGVQMAPAAGGPMSERSGPKDGGSQFAHQLRSGSPRALQRKGEEDGKEPAAPGPGTAAGLANYEATLTKWLGGKLYKAVSKELTLAKLSAHAGSAVRSALGPLGDLLKDADPNADPAQVDRAVKALKKELGTAAASYAKANGKGLQRALQGFVDANPELIVLIGLLAAAGAVAANMKLPELKTTVGLTEGLDLRLSARLGKIQNIALEQIQAELKFRSGPVKASALVAYTEEEMSAALKFRYGLGGGLDLTAAGQWSEEGGLGGKLGMEYKPNDRLSIGAHLGYDDDKGANAGVGLTYSF